MFVKNGVEYSFHHMGIPTSDPKPGERYSAMFGMHTADSDCRLLRIQWHRFEESSSLDPMIRTVPHVALKVSDLDRAVEGCVLLLAPYEPVPGYRVAIIRDGDVPVELVQTSLSDEELWERAETGSILYADDSRQARPDLSAAAAKAAAAP
ncbi:MAG: hypothetical protein P4L36_13570 [Holophaga sp.]|nr:hypothetical protein [Holophaga sp.]